MPFLMSIGGCCCGQCAIKIKSADIPPDVGNHTQLLYATGSPRPPNAGVYWLQFPPGGPTTKTLSLTSTAADVQAALEALSTIGPGNVSCTEGLGLPITISLIGDLAGTDQPLIVADSAVGCQCSVCWLLTICANDLYPATAGVVPETTVELRNAAGTVLAKKKIPGGGSAIGGCFDMTKYGSGTYTLMATPDPASNLLPITYPFAYPYTSTDCPAVTPIPTPSQGGQSLNFPLAPGYACQPNLCCPLPEQQDGQLWKPEPVPDVLYINDGIGDVELATVPGTSVWTGCAPRTASLVIVDCDHGTLAPNQSTNVSFTLTCLQVPGARWLLDVRTQGCLANGVACDFFYPIPSGACFPSLCPIIAGTGFALSTCNPVTGSGSVALDSTSGLFYIYGQNMSFNVHA